MNRTTITARSSAVFALSLLGAATLYACGGGSDGDDILPPPAFVPIAQPLPATATEYDRHIQMAKIAGERNDGIMYPEFCTTGGSNPALQNRNVIPITQLFDDFYFLGTYSVGQFVLKTQDGGFILFDTMNNAADAETLTVPQLRSAGLDPANLRGIVVTHGHGDHDGGAAYIQANFNPPVTVVGSADYTTAKPYRANLQVDSSDRTPREITIGGTTFKAVATPGHTPGTTSFIIPVHYKGQVHKIAFQGGSAFPSTAATALDYLRSVEAMYGLVGEQAADASINSHTFFDKSIDRITKIRTDGIAKTNPMIQGTPTIQLSFAVLRSCSAALLASRDATARNAVWRPTQTELYGARYRPEEGLTVAKARVSNYFNVLSGGSVKFTTSSGVTCTATTDKDGIASCKLPSTSSPGTVTAVFAGMASEGAVELTSTGTRAPD